MEWGVQGRTGWEQSGQVVGDLGDRADGATGGAYGIGLTECDGGRDALDAVDAGPIHPLEELAGVRAEGFGIAALAFGVEGVEGEGGFA